MTGEEPPTLSSAGASNASTLCETPAERFPRPRTPRPRTTRRSEARKGAPPRSGTATRCHLRDHPSGSEASRTSTSTSTSPPTRPPHSSTTRSPRFPTPPPPPSRRPRSPPSGRTIQQRQRLVLPRPAAHPSLRLPFPFPSSQLRKAHERPKFAPELERLPGHGRADPPVTPATALSVLPLHAAVAAGDVDEVRRWLDVHAPVLKPSDAADAPDKASLSTPEWPPRPVRDILGPSSESREAPDPGRFTAGRRTGSRGQGPAGARGIARSAPARDSDRSSAGDESRRGPVDARNEHGNTALAVAAALGDDGTAMELTTLLLDRGRCRRRRSPTGGRPCTGPRSRVTPRRSPRWRRGRVAG